MATNRYCYVHGTVRDANLNLIQIKFYIHTPKYSIQYLLFLLTVKKIKKVKN